MLLKDAVVQAAGFCKSKGHMALAPPADGFEYWLLIALNETAAAFYELSPDQELAPAILTAKDLHEAAKYVGDAIAVSAPREDGFATITGSKALYEIPAKAPQKPLSRPDYSQLEWRTLEPWSAVQRVLHAVGTDEDRPSLRYLCLGPEGFAATDEICVARARVDLGFESKCLIPVEVFRKWPKGEVEFATAPGLVVFRIGEESRTTEAFTGWFPEIDDYIPKEREALFELPRKELLNLVTAASRATTRHVVSLGLVGASFLVQGGEFTAYLDNQKANGDWRIMLDGKRLVKALRAADTDKIDLGYHGIDKPITLLGSQFEEAIYPLARLGDT